ncbi:MAG: 6-pyruvoyl trahydropterin synthase family protein [Candidatus Helarchaeota archaeon]
MSYKIVVNESKLGFTASHFLTNHPTCGTIHGHNYGLTISIEVKENNLDDNYMVMDFHVIKSIATKIISALDHKLMIPKDSKDLNINEGKNSIEIIVKPTEKKYVIPRSDIVILPIPATTAESLSKYIFKELQKNLTIKDYKMEVRINENRGYYAVYSE